MIVRNRRARQFHILFTVTTSTIHQKLEMTTSYNNVYNYLCILPDNSIINYNNGIFSLNDDKTDNYNYCQDIFRYFTGKDGIERVISLFELGTTLHFEYITHIQIEHESDFRNILFWGLDFPNEFATADSVGVTKDLSEGAVHQSLCVKYIGIKNGVDVGYGVFAKDLITSGSFIGEYVGVLCNTTSATNNYSVNYPCADGAHEINAKHLGNITRLINHSKDPNAKFVNISLNGIFHVVCVSETLHTYMIYMHRMMYLIITYIVCYRRY